MKKFVAVISVTAGLIACMSACDDGETTTGSSASGSTASGMGGGASSSSTNAGTGATTSSSSTGGGAAICPGPPYAASPLPANATVTPVQGGFDFLEGPVWFADTATLFFSDMHFGDDNTPPLNGPKSTMHALTAGAITDFVANASTNGLAVDLAGNILGCTHDIRGLSRFDRTTKQRTTFVDAYMGKKFNSPNDVVVRSDGNVYFTDPDWQLSQQSELPMAVYRVAPGGAGGTVELVDTLNKPNGIALSPDEKTLYVGAADSQIRKYAVAADGKTGTAEFFGNVGGPDGMAVDCAGNVYVTGGPSVTVFDPDGNELGKITGMSASATNAAFGGPNRTTLYVTAGDTLYAIELAIPGYPY